MSVSVEGYRNESFESLEAAVLETSRGRWFLEEFARRQRANEMLAMIEILKKLENAVLDSGTVRAVQAAEAPKPINREQLKFFKQDEEIFVPPVIEQPKLAVVEIPAKIEPKPEVKPESKGAKLTIQRLKPAENTPEPALVVEESKPEVIVQEAKVEPPVAEPKQRVVIIRKSASDLTEIPMVDDVKTEAAA